MGDTTNSHGEHLGHLLSYLGSTDGTDMGALTMEYDHRHALGWTASDTLGAQTFSKPLTISDSCNLTGSMPTLTSTVTMGSGAQAFTGAQLGWRKGGYLAISGLGNAADSTLTAAQSGLTVFMTNTGDTTNTTITLPSTVAGVWFTFVRAAADTNVDIRIATATGDQFLGKGITAADDKFYASEGASDAAGDLITVFGNGTTGWIVIDERGTWVRDT